MDDALGQTYDLFNDKCQDFCLWSLDKSKINFHSPANISLFTCCKTITAVYRAITCTNNIVGSVLDRRFYCAISINATYVSWLAK